MAIASSLLQATKKCRQACPPGIFMRFSILEILVNKKSKLTKLFNICWKQLLLKSMKSTWFQQTFNNFVNFELFFTKLLGIDPYEKCINTDRNFVDNFLQVVIYLALVANI